MTICILLLHHEACALTCHHYEMLRQQSAHDTGLEIVPVSFPEYTSCSLLPGTWIAERAAQFRSNPSDVFHRFIHTGGPLIPDLDSLVWDFVLHSGRKADRIILVEGDMLARCSIRDFFNPSFEHEISGSVVRRGIAGNGDWWWYDKSPEALRDEIGEAVASITPVCGIQMSWDLAERIATMVLEHPGRFDNMHVEMAFGTMARLCVRNHRLRWRAPQRLHRIRPENPTQLPRLSPRAHLTSHFSLLTSPFPSPQPFAPPREPTLPTRPLRPPSEPAPVRTNPLLLFTIYHLLFPIPPPPPHLTPPRTPCTSPPSSAGSATAAHSPPARSTGSSPD